MSPLPRAHLSVHVGLFVATCLTTTWAGAFHVHPEISWFRLDLALPLLRDGLPFSVSLMAILLSHEMGHYVAARLHKVDATLPVFLPLPFGLIGTLGAVIGMPAAVRSRNALLDIGAAGPLAGLVVALPLLVYGIHLSPVGPAVAGSLLEGNSIAYLLVKLAIKGMILPGRGLDVQLHAVAWAGWVGLLVTMINLLPIGQLDGGHIAFAYFGDGHNKAALWLHRSLLPMGVGAIAYTAHELSAKVSTSLAIQTAFFAGAPWFVWWLLLTVMRVMGGGRYHPHVEQVGLSPGRRRLCGLMLLIFIVILTPIPLRIVL